jgi:hypothetical protein
MIGILDLAEHEIFNPPRANSSTRRASISSGDKESKDGTPTGDTNVSATVTTPSIGNATRTVNTTSERGRGSWRGGRGGSRNGNGNGDGGRGGVGVAPNDSKESKEGTSAAPAATASDPFGGMFGSSSALGDLHAYVHSSSYSGNGTCPRVELADGAYSSYKDASRAHEAGYDAWLTGTLFIRILHTYSTLPSKPTSTSSIASSASIPSVNIGGTTIMTASLPLSSVSPLPTIVHLTAPAPSVGISSGETSAASTSSLSPASSLLVPSTLFGRQSSFYQTFGNRINVLFSEVPININGGDTHLAHYSNVFFVDSDTDITNDLVMYSISLLIIIFLRNDPMSPSDMQYGNNKSYICYCLIVHGLEALPHQQ